MRWTEDERNRLEELRWAKDYGLSAAYAADAEFCIGPIECAAANREYQRFSDLLDALILEEEMRAANAVD